MRPILNTPFNSTSGSYISASERIPTAAFSHYFVVNATQAGTLHIELRDVVNDAWIRTSSAATVAAGGTNAGTVVTVDLAGVEVRVQWIPDAVTSSDRVTIFFGTTGVA